MRPPPKWLLGGPPAYSHFLLLQLRRQKQLRLQWRLWRRSMLGPSWSRALEILAASRMWTRPIRQTRESIHRLQSASLSHHREIDPQEPWPPETAAETAPGSSLDTRRDILGAAGRKAFSLKDWIPVRGKYVNLAVPSGRGAFEKTLRVHPLIAKPCELRVELGYGCS